MIECIANFVGSMRLSLKNSLKTFALICIFATNEAADNACLTTRMVQLIA